MIEFIKRSEYKEEIQYRLEFDRADGSGYCFDCNKQGELLQPNPGALRNLAQCRSGKDYDGVELHNNGVDEYLYTWTEPAIGRCNCGQEVELSGFTNACECGIDYNSSGQQLAPREQWGCETGESLTDILNIK